MEADCRDKLLSYLSGIYAGGERVRLPGSMSELAQTLGVGRASLYRAFDVLEEEDILRRDGRTILVRNAERLSIERKIYEVILMKKFHAVLMTLLKIAAFSACSGTEKPRGIGTGILRAEWFSEPETSQEPVL